MKLFSKICIALIIAVASLSTSGALQAANLPNDGGLMQMHFLNGHQVKAGNAISAKLESAVETNAKLSVENVNGKKLYDMDILVNKGLNMLKFKVAEIPAGVYFVKLKSENETERLTFEVK